MASSSSSLSSLCFLSVSCFVILVLFHGGVVVNGSSLIEETCKKAATDPQLKYDFCVAALQTDPKSQSADLQGLGVISIELTIKNATSIGSRIKELLSDGSTSAKAKEYLGACLDLYNDAISDANEAIDDFKSKDYRSANVKLSAVLDASSNCEDGFKEVQLTSPLKAEDGIFFELTTIPLAISNMF